MKECKMPLVQEMYGKGSQHACVWYADAMYVLRYEYLGHVQYFVSMCYPKLSIFKDRYKTQKCLEGSELEKRKLCCVFSCSGVDYYKGITDKMYSLQIEDKYLICKIYDKGEVAQLILEHTE